MLSLETNSVSPSVNANGGRFASANKYKNSKFQWGIVLENIEENSAHRLIML